MTTDSTGGYSDVESRIRLNKGKQLCPILGISSQDRVPAISLLCYTTGWWNLRYRDDRDVHEAD
jgi:hypothetical protein